MSSSRKYLGYKRFPLGINTDNSLASIRDNELGRDSRNVVITKDGLIQKETGYKSLTFINIDSLSWNYFDKIVGKDEVTNAIMGLWEKIFTAVSTYASIDTPEIIYKEFMILEDASFKGQGNMNKYFEAFLSPNLVLNKKHTFYRNRQHNSTKIINRVKETKTFDANETIKAMQEAYNEFAKFGTVDVIKQCGILPIIDTSKTPEKEMFFPNIGGFTIFSKAAQQILPNIILSMYEKWETISGVVYNDKIKYIKLLVDKMSELGVGNYDFGSLFHFLHPHQDEKRNKIPQTIHISKTNVLSIVSYDKDYKPLTEYLEFPENEFLPDILIKKAYTPSVDEILSSTSGFGGFNIINPLKFKEIDTKNLGIYGAYFTQNNLKYYGVNIINTDDGEGNALTTPTIHVLLGYDKTKSYKMKIGLRHSITKFNDALQAYQEVPSEKEDLLINGNKIKTFAPGAEIEGELDLSKLSSYKKGTLEIEVYRSSATAKTDGFYMKNFVGTQITPQSGDKAKDINNIIPVNYFYKTTSDFFNDGSTPIKVVGWYSETALASNNNIQHPKPDSVAKKGWIIVSPDSQVSTYYEKDEEIVLESVIYKHPFKISSEKPQDAQEDKNNIEMCTSWRYFGKRLVRFGFENYLFMSDPSEETYFNIKLKINDMQKGEHITDIAEFVDGSLIIFSQTRTWKLYSVTGDISNPTTWAITTLSDNIGCKFQYGTLTVDQRLFILSERGIFVLIKSMYTNNDQSFIRIDRYSKTNVTIENFYKKLLNKNILKTKIFLRNGMLEIYFATYDFEKKEYISYRLKWDASGSIQRWLIDEFKTKVDKDGNFKAGLDFLDIISFENTHIGVTLNNSLVKFDDEHYQFIDENYRMAIQTKDFDFGEEFNLKKIKELDLVLFTPSISKQRLMLQHRIGNYITTQDVSMNDVVSVENDHIVLDTNKYNSIEDLTDEIKVDGGLIFDDGSWDVNSFDKTDIFHTRIKILGSKKDVNSGITIFSESAYPLRLGAIRFKITQKSRAAGKRQYVGSSN